jgi:riboflavin kinase/FMN adenylyltransferase
MKLLRLVDLGSSNNFNDSFVTVGNFDGVHLGHQYILNQVKLLALKKKKLSCVVCFEPQPKEFFMGQKAPKRITPFRDKMLAFKKVGVDKVLCLNFNCKLASLSAQSFVRNILVEGVNAKHIIVGSDFRFGSNREGDFFYLKETGIRMSFTVQSAQSYLTNNVRVSSSQIRELLQDGHFKEAQKLLGRSYSLSGRVHHGKKNGRRLGFPTINIPIPVDIIVNGVFIVKVYLKDNFYFGIANIGKRPTLCNKLRLLEINIFNFERNLYGQYVTVEFLKLIRREKKFSNFNKLVEQIRLDKSTAEEWIKYSITKDTW